jgi:hypothetical protein
MADSIQCLVLGKDGIPETVTHAKDRQCNAA